MPREFRSRRVEAVVLRHSDWGEADRLLVLFTRELGKVRAIAKGVRRLRSRKAGHLQPFSRVTLLLAQGRDLWIISQAEMQDAYQPVREDLVRLAYAAYIVEVLDRFTYEEGENQTIFRLLVETLQRIAQESIPFIAVRYFEMHLLDLAGFRPNLVTCVECGATVEARDQFFSALQGGVRCPRCGAAPGSHPISVQALHFLRHIQRSTFQVASRIHPKTSVQDEVEALLNYYLTYLLERSLNSPAFLHHVRDQNEA